GPAMRRARPGPPVGNSLARLLPRRSHEVDTSRAVSWRPGVAASAPGMARARVRAGCPDRGRSGSRPTGHGDPPNTAQRSSHRVQVARACPFAGLSLGPTRGFPVTLVSPRQPERRQPGFATDGPQLVGRHQLVGCVQRSEVHFDLVVAASEDGRAAARTEEPPGVIAHLALDHYRVPREYRGGVEQRPMVLAAVEAVA